MPAAAGDTICAAQVCRALPNLGRCEHCVDCDSAHPPGSCARGCHLCTRAARGGGDAPSRAPFKRCQGLIDEKCPQQVRTCLRRRRRPGSGGCFSGSAAVAGSLPQRRPRGIPGSPKARVGVEAGAGREPHLLLLFHGNLLPRSPGLGVFFRSWYETRTSGASSVQHSNKWEVLQDSQLSLSPKDFQRCRGTLLLRVVVVYFSFPVFCSVGRFNPEPHAF